MTIFTCDERFEAMMTCVYEAWAARLGHANVRLETEPIAQTELFCEYRHVAADAEKAAKVVRSVQRKISWEAYVWVYRAAMACDDDRLDVIYRFLVLGFACGREVVKRLSEPAVARMMELSRRVGNEAHYFREFSRFDLAERGVYVSHIEPKSNVLPMVAPHFADRMISENWMMIDDSRRIAAVHPKNREFYLTELTEEELHRLEETEERGDIYTRLWKEFFETIGIEARKNPACQRTHMPKWYRAHATEFR